MASLTDESCGPSKLVVWWMGCPGTVLTQLSLWTVQTAPTARGSDAFTRLWLGNMGPFAVSLGEI